MDWVGVNRSLRETLVSGVGLFMDWSSSKLTDPQREISSFLSHVRVNTSEIYSKSSVAFVKLIEDNLLAKQLSFHCPLSQKNLNKTNQWAPPPIVCHSWFSSFSPTLLIPLHILLKAKPQHLSMSLWLLGLWRFPGRQPLGTDICTQTHPARQLQALLKPFKQQTAADAR